MEDISGRRRASVNSAVERAGVAIIMTDPLVPDNPITYVNEAFETITGYPREDALGRNCRFLQGPRTDAADVEAIRAGLRSGQEFQVTLTNHRADGTPFRNQLLVSPVRDATGEINAYFGVQRDVTDKPGDEPRGDANSDNTLSLLRELQHRVKNHLSMIVGMIRMQAKREVTPESLRAVARRVEALALLYEEVLGASLNGGDNDEIRVDAYLDRISKALGGLTAAESISVKVDCEEITLPMDQAARLGLLLSELLTNALEHAFEGRETGTVKVQCHRLDDGGVCLAVEDDGVGMPEGSTWPNQSAGIAQQQQRADSTHGALDTTGSRTRSGVGGSIVLALTETLDAKLDVERLAEQGGEGTRVLVEFEPQNGGNAGHPATAA